LGGTLKFYIAAKFDERKEEVESLIKFLESKGHTVTCDWTKHKPIKPYKDNQKLAREYSTADITGVSDSDIFIILSSANLRGAFAEFGAAIESNVKTGKPKIYAVGEHNTISVFYFHPSIIRVDSIEDVLKIIGK
jgi:hypothetical protein